MRWVEKIREGNHRAFETLFRTYYEPLHDFVRRQIANPQEAEGIVEEIFLSLWQRRADWKPNRSVRAYLYGAARNKVRKHIRHRQVRRRYEVSDEPDDIRGGRSPEDDVRHRELTGAVEQAIEGLPARRRLVYILSRNHGLTYAEIASALDISVSTVEVQMWRALKYLREELQSYVTTES